MGAICRINCVSVYIITYVMAILVGFRGFYRGLPTYGSSESQPTLAQPTILLAQIIPHQILRFYVGKENCFT